MEAKLIQWTADLGVDILWMDYQHQTLIDKINRLHTAIVERKDESLVIEVMIFLDEYIKGHFSLEEVYMQKYDFPASSLHTAEHDQFRANLRELKSLLDTPRQLIAETLCYDLFQWFNNHIKTTDKALGLYLQSGKSCP